MPFFPFRLVFACLDLSVFCSLMNLSSIYQRYSVGLGALAHLPSHEAIPRYERAHSRRNSLLRYQMSRVTTHESCNAYDNRPSVGPVPFKSAVQWL